MVVDHFFRGLRSIKRGGGRCNRVVRGFWIMCRGKTHEVSSGGGLACSEEAYCGTLKGVLLQGYLAHKKQRPPRTLQ